MPHGVVWLRRGAGADAYTRVAYADAAGTKVAYAYALRRIARRDPASGAVRTTRFYDDFLRAHAGEAFLRAF